MHDYKNLKELMSSVTEVLVVDLAEKVYLLHNFIEHMIPLPDGLYDSITNVRMFANKDKKYYECGGFKQVTSELSSLKDFQNCKGVIKSEDGSFLQKPNSKIIASRKRLTVKPSMDNRLLNIIEKVVDDYLYSLCPHTKTTRNYYSIEKLLKEDLTQDKIYYLVDSLPVDLTNLIDELSNFVGRDTWHMYYTMRKGNALIITKTIDFRIFDWYRMMFEKEELNSDEDGALDIYNIFKNK